MHFQLQVGGESILAAILPNFEWPKGMTYYRWEGLSLKFRKVSLPLYEILKKDIQTSVKLLLGSIFQHTMILDLNIKKNAYMRVQLAKC